MLIDKQAQEEAERASRLDWTLVRPPRFTENKPRSEVRVMREGEDGRVGHVVRADLAVVPARLCCRAYLCARSGGGRIVRVS
jgi:uncharacterized protein YbjT (DUF2867 family)